MNTEWQFSTDDQSTAFCGDIAEALVSLFGIPRHEAVGRINRHWAGQAIIGEDMVYHEVAAYWASTIYFGKDSRWWLTDAEREASRMPALVPRPYP